MCRAMSKMSCHPQLRNVFRSQVKCGVTAGHTKREVSPDARCKAEEAIVLCRGDLPSAENYSHFNSDARPGHPPRPWVSSTAAPGPERVTGSRLIGPQMKQMMVLSSWNENLKKQTTN